MNRFGMGIVVPLTLALCLANGIVTAETVTCTDKLGRDVTVSVPVSRAVIFQTYELIPALGIWDSVAGIGRYAYDNDLMRATRPDIEKTIPSAGTGSDMNLEALLKLNPDIVITWIFRPDSVKFMEAKGLQVIAVSPESISELYEVIRLHGRIFGKEDRAEMCIAKVESIFQLVRDKVSGIPRERKQKVLFLLGKPTTVACGLGVAAALVKLAGGINPASSTMQTGVDVSMEQIIAWNPDVIFIWGHAGYTAQNILDGPQWRSIKAVSNRKVFKAPMWSTWSLRIAPMVLWMAAKTYPEQFADIKMERSLEDFFQTIYGISYGKVTQIER